MPGADREPPTAAQRRAVAELLRVAPVAGELGERFASGGHRLYLVGGSVRDALLGHLGEDLDFTTDARPERVQELLDGWADAIWDVGIAFGTVAAAKGRFRCEVTTFRAEAYERSSRKPAVDYGDTLEADLLRRDFTVNAMAVPVPLAAAAPLVDPTGGLVDLQHRRLRTPGLPRDSFGDDPLRMLRAARFRAQLGFELVPAARQAIVDMTERIGIVSAERIRDELTKLLLAARPRSGLSLLVETGLAERVLPELPRLRLEVDEHHHHKDVYEHTLTVLDRAVAAEPDGPDLTLRWAALLHDIGKPKTRSLEPCGRVSFHHHEVVGAAMARARLGALRYPAALVADVSRLIELHLRFHGYADGEWTDSAVRRYVRDAGPVLDRLHRLVRSDCTTRNRRRAAGLAVAYDSLERRIADLAAREELDRLRPDLDGNEIMALLGIGPGPVIGAAREYLLELRIEKGPLPRTDAVAALRAWAAEHGADGAGRPE